MDMQHEEFLGPLDSCIGTLHDVVLIVFIHLMYFYYWGSELNNKVPNSKCGVKRFCSICYCAHGFVAHGFVLPLSGIVEACYFKRNHKDSC